MLVIRLQRIGRKNMPIYRIIVQEKDWAPSSKSIEIVGQYNPHTEPATIKLEKEKIEKWLKNGAQPSATVHNMLVNAGIINAPKMKSVQSKLKEKGKEEADTAKPDIKSEEKKEETKPEVKPEEKPAEEKKEEVKA